MLMKGYNLFTCDPNKFKEVNCRVCNDECDVERNKYGPTCYAAAVGNHKILHDEFRCKNSSEEWHKKALKLLQEKDNTASDFFKCILDLEISNLVSANK